MKKRTKKIGTLNYGACLYLACSNVARAGALVFISGRKQIFSRDAGKRFGYNSF
jgi:hypothetical protein